MTMTSFLPFSFFLIFLISPIITEGIRSSIIIGGTVYYDINQNGNRDANEYGVPSAPVQIRSCTNNATTRSSGNTRTNPSGEFYIELEKAGCYYALFDVTVYNFTSKGRGSDVDSRTGRTDDVEIRDGGAHFWYAGIIPEEGTNITLTPTNDPTTSMVPSTYPPTIEPSANPTMEPTSAIPTVMPTTGRPTEIPSVSYPPSTSPSKSTSPSGCVVRDVVEDNIMSSAPILRSSFGTIFSVSTPPPDADNTNNISMSNETTLMYGSFNNDVDVEEEYIQITSLSLRVLTPLLSVASETEYQVWYQPADYRSNVRGEVYDMRGNLEGWTLVAGGNSLGYQPPGLEGEDEETGKTNNNINNRTNTNTVYQEPMILDSNFQSGAFPSDSNVYKPIPSSFLADGGKDTLNAGGSRIKTYLYKIPTSVFVPISIPRYGGKASFYVTLNRSLLQYGDAGDDEWDAIDVENGEFDDDAHDDDEEDMNLRIHVGEGVTSNPWMDNANFYKPRRFLGKVWYEHTVKIPCGLHVGAPSQAPSVFEVPPLPPGSSVVGSSVTSGGEFDTVMGKAVDATFVLSVFLQQDIRFARNMNDEVMDAFRRTMVDFLNEEWVMRHCVWGVELDVEFQMLSLLEGVRQRRRRRLLGERQLRGGGMERMQRHSFGALSPPRRRRHLQTDITILQVEMFVKGVAHDDPRVCPASSTPATPTTRGDDWDETMSQIGIDFILENADRLGERLKMADAYFGELFAVSADPDLLVRPEETSTDIVGATTREESTLPLIPIIAAICAAVLLLCLLGIGYYCRKCKRRSKEEEEPSSEDDAISTPSGIIIITDTKCDGSSMGHKTGETKGFDSPDPDDFASESDEPPEMPALPLSNDPLVVATPALRKVPQLEEVIMMRGLPRRRSDPNMVTVITHPKELKRTRSLSCLREVWINLNKPSSKNNPDLAGGYLDQLLDGTLYPVDDHDILYWERERYLTEKDPQAPYVPHGGSIEHNFIDEVEAIRIELPKSNGGSALASVLSDDIFSDSGEEMVIAATMAVPKMNPLVMQQVEMLEAKWKQLREEYNDDGEYDSGENDIEGFDVNERIEQLMGRLEKLELDRKLRLSSLKRQEEEEDELARKRMVRAGTGINYEEELSRDFVIRKKRKKIKSRKDQDLDDLSEETSSEEEDEDGEFDVKWMRLKVPLAAQDVGAMRSLVNKGKDMDS